MLTDPLYAALFDFSAPCSQTKILIFQGTYKPLFYAYNFEHKDIILL